MKDERLLIKTILEYCDAISSDLFVIENDLESFMSDKPIQRSCAFSIIQIGEYAKRISDHTRKRYPDIDWTGIISMRNLIAHDYVNIDHSQLWNTITEDIPKLRERLMGVLKQMDSEFATDVKHL